MDCALKLEILNENLQKQLTHAEAAKENQDLYFKNFFQDLLQTNERYIQKTLCGLNSNVEEISKLYQSEKQSFFYQLPKEEVTLEEDEFTSALTQYTLKQFFDGIGDLAGGSDSSRYDLLDFTKPETLLIKGESEDIRQQDRKELQRLKSQYVISESSRINSEIKCVKLRREVALAEKQLQQLTSGTLMLSKNKLNDDVIKLDDEINKAKQEVQDIHDIKLQPLLNSLQELHSARVLQGNYDLKLARQNYFLSKQDKVIDELLSQCARNYFRSMLYEIDLKEHRSTYHLMLSSKSLIEKEIERIQKRINYLSDPMLIASNSNKEIISSKDELLNKLYDVIVKRSTGHEELYRTYESLKQETQILSSKKKKMQMIFEKVLDELYSYIELFENTLQTTEKHLNVNYSQSNEELTSLIANLEDNLSIAEHQVNEIVKDIVRKRKILSSDPLKMMERSIFINFFSDPARLKVLLSELDSRVMAFSTA